MVMDMKLKGGGNIRVLYMGEWNCQFGWGWNVGYLQSLLDKTTNPPLQADLLFCCALNPVWMGCLPMELIPGVFLFHGRWRQLERLARGMVELRLGLLPVNIAFSAQ